MATYRLPIGYLEGYLLATYRLLVGYLRFTGNIVSISRDIAYKCPILADLRDRIDHKKRFLNDQKAT